MDTWRVLGFEMWKTERGDNCVRLYAIRPLVLADGSQGEGFETQRFFYKPMYLKNQYTPQVNQLIVPVEGRYAGLEQVFVVGMYDPSRQGD